MKKIKNILLIVFCLLLITGCGEKKEQVVIYTSAEEERNQKLKEMVKEEFPDIDVVIQYLSTGNSAAKIKAEKEQVEADIVIDLETAHMADIQENFADLKDIDTSFYLDGVNKSNNYVTWIKYTLSLIIDKKYFEEHKLEIPKTYEDLLKKEYKGLIAMPDPKTSGTGYGFFLNAVNEMGEKKATEYFKKLSNNIREYTTSGSGPTNLLKQGEIAIAMGMTSQGVEMLNNGYNVEIIELKTGSPYNTTSAGIIKGKENKESVKKVFSWLIKEFGKVDKETWFPAPVIKDQKNNIPNYPNNLKDANMDGIDSTERKEELIKVWNEING